MPYASTPLNQSKAQRLGKNYISGVLWGVERVPGNIELEPFTITSELLASRDGKACIIIQCRGGTVA